MEEALGGASSRRLSVGPPRAPGDGARVRGRRPPVFPACVHRNLDTDPPLRAEDATAEGDRRPAAPNEEQPGTTHSGGRGQYDRSSGKGARKPWLLHVQQYVDAVVSGNFAQLGVACASTCLNAGKCIELCSMLTRERSIRERSVGALNQERSIAFSDIDGGRLTPERRPLVRSDRPSSKKFELIRSSYHTAQRDARRTPNDRATKYLVPTTYLGASRGLRPRELPTYLGASRGLRPRELPTYF